MVAPLEYSNSILRTTQLGSPQGDNNAVLQFDKIVYQSIQDGSSPKPEEDVYAALMDREGTVLEKINKAAKDFLADKNRRRDVFWDMTMSEVAANILETFRVILWHIFSGKAHVAIAMVFIDPNTRIYTGILLIVASILVWSLQY